MNPEINAEWTAGVPADDGTFQLWLVMADQPFRLITLAVPNGTGTGFIPASDYMQRRIGDTNALHITSYRSPTKDDLTVFGIFGYES